jgi:CBS-domain-containing membrane protein
MKNRTVADVMTRTVVMANASTGFKDIVRRMEESGVSALPVVNDQDHLVGIVSEADLLLKEERANQPTHWRPFERGRRRIERTKAEAIVAALLMTAPVITIGPKATLGQAARLLHQNRVKQLPVVDEEDKIVGIVSRTDLLKVFMRPDEEIQREVAEDVLIHSLAIGPHSVRTTVQDGVVTVEGRVEHRSLVPLLIGLVRGVDGVVGVENRLSFEVDDVHVWPQPLTPWGVYPRP